MVLKHIDFYDSPTMRELARQSLKAGTIKPAPVVKEAFKKNSLEPSSNVFTDMVRLADGLRSKGYVKEAQALEEKIVNFKKAEREYDRLLDDAHPEGDVEMAEASNGLGVVETLPTAHQKNVEMVQKRPTGKQAQVSNILAAVDHVFSKYGQRSFEELAGDETTLANKNKSTERVGKIEKINGILKQNITGVKGDLDGALSVAASDKIAFDNNLLLDRGNAAYIAAYCKYRATEDVTPVSISAFFDKYNQVYGKGVQASADVILAKMSELEGPALEAYVNMIEPGAFQKAFPKPKEEPKDVTLWDKTTSALGYAAGAWVFDLGKWVFDKGKANAQLRKIAAALNDSMIKQMNHFVGLNEVAGASQKLKEEITNMVAPLRVARKSLDEVVLLPPNAESNSDLIRQLSAINNNISNFISESSAKIEPYVGLFLGGQNLIVGPIVSANTKLSKLIEEIVANPIVDNDRIPNQETYDGLITMLLAASQNLARHTSKTYPQDSKDYSDGVNDVNMLEGAAKALQDGKGLPYSLVAETVSKFLPASTMAELANSVNHYREAVANVVTASNNSDLIKLSTPLPGPGKAAPATAPKATPAGQKAPVAGAAGLAKADMNDPRQAATALMQQHLAYLAQGLLANKDKFKDFNASDAANIVRTGPKANPQINTYDGKWGSETENALKLAKKYLDQLGVQGLDFARRYNAGVFAADTEAVANKNATLLSQANKSLGSGAPGLAGGKEADNTLYDKLPSKIDWGNVEYPLMQHEVPVKKSDMANLGSLYDLIVKNGWLDVATSKNKDGFNIEGFPAKVWMQVVQWFQKRAQFVHNASLRTDKNAATIARQYYDDAKKLEGQLQSFFASSGKNSRNESDVINIDDLREHSTRVAGKPGSRPQSGAAYRQDSSTGNNQGGDLEGSDWGGSGGQSAKNLPPPIDPNSGNIDLNLPWYGGLVGTHGIRHASLLSLQMFESYPANQLTEAFFASSNPGSYDAIKKYDMLLNAINQGINTALGSWASRTKPNTAQREDMMEWSVRWRSAIEKQKKDLVTYVNQARR